MRKNTSDGDANAIDLEAAEEPTQPATMPPEPISARVGETRTIACAAEQVGVSPRDALKAARSLGFDVADSAQELTETGFGRLLRAFGRT